MQSAARRAREAKVNNQAFVIQNLAVPPGTRIHFDMPAAQLYTHTPLDMPVEVVNGRKAGPTLLVCAAIHGDELNGVEIIRRLRALRELDRLKGTLLLVPIVNLFGFIHQSRYLPDRRDLNRSFPGSDRGSLTSRFASLFFREIVQRCTHIVDLHTGALHRDNLPQVRASLHEPGVEVMAQAFGMPVIVNTPGAEGTLRFEAGKLGIPNVTYEAGEALRLDEKSIVAGVRGIVNVMRNIGMLTPLKQRTAPRRLIAEPFVAQSTSWFRANADGLFRPLVRLGARVNKGDIVGVISAPYGEVEALLESPRGGIIIGMNNMPLVNEGEALLHIATFEESDALIAGEIIAQQEAMESDPLYETTDNTVL